MLPDEVPIFCRQTVQSAATAEIDAVTNDGRRACDDAARRLEALRRRCSGTRTATDLRERNDSLLAIQLEFPFQAAGPSV